jgi:hypothetical protein
LENGHNPALPGENQSPWLAWEELFAGLPTPPLVTPLLPKADAGQLRQAPGSAQWTEENINHLDGITNSALTPSPGHVPMAIAQRAATQYTAVANPGLVNGSQNPWQSEALDDPWEEKTLNPPRINQPRGTRQLNSVGEVIRNPRQEQELETAFDWIEAQVQSLGYDKHILVWCLEWLDRLVYWLEQGIEKVWHWLRQKFGQAESSSLGKLPD